MAFRASRRVAGMRAHLARSGELIPARESGFARSLGTCRWQKGSGPMFPMINEQLMASRERGLAEKRRAESWARERDLLRRARTADRMLAVVLALDRFEREERSLRRSAQEHALRDGRACKWRSRRLTVSRVSLMAAAHGTGLADRHTTRRDLARLEEAGWLLLSTRPRLAVRLTETARAFVANASLGRGDERAKKLHHPVTLIANTSLSG